MLLKLLLLAFTCCVSGLSGGIFDHLKKIEDKGPTKQMRGIDFIYTINLDQRPEKFESCNRQLNPFGIYPYRFSAVNGWEIPLATVNDLGVKFQKGMSSSGWGTCYLSEDWQPHHEVVHVLGRNYFCHCMARGTIGIVLSHLSILKDAYDAGYETIWVMEDDIEVIQNPHLISDSIEKIDRVVGAKNWDILFTDQDTKNQKGEYVSCTAAAWRPNFTPSNPSRFASRKVIRGQFRKIGARYGAYSMIVRRSGMKKLLDFYQQHQAFLPFDMDFTLPNDIKLYTVLEDIVSTQANALSDNGVPNYKNNKQ